MSDRIDLKKLCEEVGGKFDGELNACLIKAPKQWHARRPEFMLVKESEVSSNYLLIDLDEGKIEEPDSMKSALAGALLDPSSRRFLIIDLNNKALLKAKRLDPRSLFMLYSTKAHLKIGDKK